MKNWSIRFILRLLHPPHIALSTVLRIPGGNLQTSGWYFCRGRPLTGLATGFSGTRKFFPFGGASRPGENSGCKGKPDTHHSEGSCFSREITCCSRTFTSPCWPRRSAGTFLSGVSPVRRKKGIHSLFPFFRSILPEGGANSRYLLSSMLIKILSTLA